MPRTAVARPGRRPSWTCPGLGSAAAAAAIVAGMSYLAPGRLEPPRSGGEAVAPAAATAPAPLWQPIVGPPRFVLPVAGLEALVREHAARRHVDGTREDVLTLGTFETGGPHLRLVVRTGAPATQASLFLELARHAAGAGIAVVRTGQPGSFASKLGAGETAEAVLAGATERPCSAFRIAEPGLRLLGWACDLPEAAHTCIIDGLALAEPREDPERVRFAEAERLRDPACAPARGPRRKP
jgi:hypothetical protein